MDWKPCGSATLVGSMPHKDRDYAISFILDHLVDIPVWPQLPAYAPEQMMNQYLEGLPGYDNKKIGQSIIEVNSESFDNELYRFYEDYFSVIEGRVDIKDSRFRFGPETGKTFRSFVERLSNSPRRTYKAIKGQVVGPFTLLSSLKSTDGRLLLYNDQMSDVVVKHLAMKALWQASWLKPFSERVIIFFDEPALSGFGSSAFIGVSDEYIINIFDEISNLLTPRGVLAGIHVCANTDWSLLLKTKIDIINFDAYNYGNKFCIYNNDIRRFLANGGIIAWGIVPTDDARKIEGENEESLSMRLINLFKQYFPDSEMNVLLTRAIITPSCGCGTLTEKLAEKVVKMTVDCSNRIKEICNGVF